MTDLEQKEIFKYNKYRFATRHYDIVWQKESTPRTDLIQKTYTFPDSIVKKIEAGLGFPDFKLNAEAQKKLNKFIKLLRQMPLKKRTHLANFIREEREHGSSYIREEALEYLAGYLNFTEFFDSTLKDRIENTKFYLQYKKKKEDLSKEIFDASLIMDILLDEDMEKVAQEIQKPDTYSEKLLRKMRIAKATINFGVEKVVEKVLDVVNEMIYDKPVLYVVKDEEDPALVQETKTATVPTQSMSAQKSSQENTQTEPHRIATKRLPQQAGLYTSRQKED